MTYELLTPDSSTVAFIDHELQMFFGTMSRERTNIRHNVPASGLSASWGAPGCSRFAV
ncbi:hypothetical protein SAMN05414139_08597 [Burkholderia sp. D7]|nr:hypothetical protein SAMN05414139_08597 [Burkholderia sp. D7]